MDELLEPNRPSGLSLTHIGSEYTLTWEESENADGYKVYFDEELIADTQELSCTMNEEMDGYLRVVAYNSISETESDLVRTITVPSLPSDISVTHTKNVNGYSFTVKFTDTSDMEDGHKIKYRVDDGDEEIILCEGYEDKATVNQMFLVPEILDKIEIVIASYNSSGDNDATTIVLYTPPSLQWSYMQSTHDVIAAWGGDGYGNDIMFKLRYRINGGGYKYELIENIGGVLSHKIGLREDEVMDIAICAVTTQDGFYTDNIVVSKSNDVNLTPPGGFSYVWEDENIAMVKWTDNYEVENSYELVYKIDDGEDVVVNVPSTSKEDVGSEYSQDITIPYGSICNAKVRMTWDLNESDYATIEIPHQLDTPTNVQISTIGTANTITWSGVNGATGYEIYLDGRLIADVMGVTTVELDMEMYGMVSVKAHNEWVSSEESEKVYIRTMPNKPLWVEANYDETDLGYDINVQWADNSWIETHYRVEYEIDDGTMQSIVVDTENMPIPPNATLDEEKPYLMWADIETVGGEDVEVKGVTNEEIKNIVIQGESDIDGYYPIGLGGYHPIEICVNEDKTPIRFNTTIESDGDEKAVVDVANFQEIDMVIYGKTDKSSGTSQSVKPYINNTPHSRAYTVTLNHIKGHTNVNGLALQNNEVYGLSLGEVDGYVDKAYKDRVVYETKQYRLIGTESWLIDNTKTNSTHTTIHGHRLSNCPTYQASESFKVKSNYFKRSEYLNMGTSHLSCAYTDKLVLTFENSKVGITYTESATVKINKCKAFMGNLSIDFRYVVTMPETVMSDIDFFIGDHFELGGIDGNTDICNTKTGEVEFKTKPILDSDNRNIARIPVGVHQKAYGLRVDLNNDAFTRIGDAEGATLDSFYAYQPWCNMYRCIVEGQHMVKIPCFYYKRVPVKVEDIPQSTDNNEIGQQLVVWEDWISMYPYEDYYVHPAFIRNGKVVPYIYFSAYEGSIFDTSANTYLKEDEQVADFNEDLLCSIPNAKPCSGKTQNLTIENCRKLANSRSKNSEYDWFQQDFTTVSAIQMLITIACGSYDCQASIGRGVVDMPDNPNTENNSLKTGQTQYMGIKCGYNGTNGKSSVNFFGIENFWGNIWKFVDGFNIEAKNIHQGWISNDDLTVNTSSNKDNLGFTMSKTNGYMSRMGWDNNIDFAFIPTATKSGEPISKDYFYQNNAYGGFLVAVLGGYWTDGSNAGCFCWHCRYAASDRSRSRSARLACIKKQ